MKTLPKSKQGAKVVTDPKTGKSLDIEKPHILGEGGRAPVSKSGRAPGVGPWETRRKQAAKRKIEDLVNSKEQSTGTPLSDLLDRLTQGRTRR